MHNTVKIRFRITLFLTALFAISVGRALAEAPDSPIKIGFTIVLSGPWANWGETMKNGMVLASRKTVNRFEIDIQDDQCESSHALTNIRRFLDVDEVKIVFAGCVEVLEAIAPPALQNNVLILGLGGMDYNILSKYRNVISLYSMTDTEARFLVPYWAKLGNIHRVSIIEGTSVFADQIGETMESLLQKYKIELLSRQKIPVETNDFRTIALRVLKEKPDAVFLFVGENSLGLAIRQIRELGYKGEIYSRYVFEAEEVKKTGGAALEGVKYTYPVNSSEGSEESAKVIEEYKTTFGAMPNANALLGYDSLILLDKLVEKCGNVDPQCISHGLATLGKHQGVAGAVVLGADRSAIRPQGIKEFKNGGYVWIEKNITPAY